MRLMQRLQLRMFVNRRLRQTKDNDERAALQAMLSDGTLFNEVGDSLVKEQESDTGHPLRDFLDWLLANQEGIIAFIKAIMALFGVLGASRAAEPSGIRSYSASQAHALSRIARKLADRKRAGRTVDLGGLLDVIAEILKDGSFSRDDLETVIAAAEQAYDTIIVPIDLPMPDFLERRVDALTRTFIRPGVTAVFDMIFSGENVG